MCYSFCKYFKVNIYVKFFYLYQGSLHTTAQKFENAALVFTVRPTVHTNPSRKQSFSKTLFKPGNRIGTENMFDAFSEWNLRFQIPPPRCGQRLR